MNLNIIHHIHSVAFGEGDPRPHKADYRNSNKSGPGALGGTGRPSSAQRSLDGGRSCRLPPRREARTQAWAGRARQLREPLTAGPSGSHVAIASPEAEPGHRALERPEPASQLVPGTGRLAPAPRGTPRGTRPAARHPPPAALPLTLPPRHPSRLPNDARAAPKEGTGSLLPWSSGHRPQRAGPHVLPAPSPRAPHGTPHLLASERHVSFVLSEVGASPQGPHVPSPGQGRALRRTSGKKFLEWPVEGERAPPEAR